MRLRYQDGEEIQTLKSLETAWDNCAQHFLILQVQLPQGETNLNHIYLVIQIGMIRLLMEAFIAGVLNFW